VHFSGARSAELAPNSTQEQREIRRSETGRPKDQRRSGGSAVLRTRKIRRPYTEGPARILWICSPLDASYQARKCQEDALGTLDEFDQKAMVDELGRRTNFRRMNLTTKPTAAMVDATMEFNYDFFCGRTHCALRR